jgi:hypothetical protein
VAYREPMDALACALDAIDAANSGDPRLLDGEPLALAQGRIAEAWVVRLRAEASDALRLAARAHHLRRWVVPRTGYPEGRAGYLRWRRDQKTRHAVELSEILSSAGVHPAIITRSAAIVAKSGLGVDPEVQVFEDAVCLTFMQTQLAATAERLADARMVEVVAKTLAKMSDDGKSAALTIELGDAGADLVARALERQSGA